MIIQRIVSLVIGYFIGNIVLGFILGKTEKIDLRNEGSGSVGTTNTIRILGLPKGVATFLWDVIKPMLAMLVVFIIFAAFTSNIKILMLYAGFGAIIGHDFPVLLKFHGGKGVATSVGVMLILYPICFPVCAAIFFTVVFLQRYISLGSILAAIALGMQILVFGLCGDLAYFGDYQVEAVIIAHLGIKKRIIEREV